MGLGMGLTDVALSRKCCCHRGQLLACLLNRHRSIANSHAFPFRSFRDINRIRYDSQAHSRVSAREGVDGIKRSRANAFDLFWAILANKLAKFWLWNTR